jgi:hypothetical protein
MADRLTQLQDTINQVERIVFLKIYNGFVDTYCKGCTSGPFYMPGFV